MQLLLLALDAALYPTLLAVVVVLLAQPHPRRLLTAYLGGGMLVSIAAGLAIVFALKNTKVVTNDHAGFSWSLDLAVGGLALLVAVAIALRADQRTRERRERRREAKGKAKPENHEPWSQRLLARDSTPLVFAASLAINLPGAAYLVACKDIAAGHHSVVIDVTLVVGFNVIMFLLAEVPLFGLLFAPEPTGALVKRLNAWMSRHGREIAVSLCVILGVYLIARGIAHD